MQTKIGIIGMGWVGSSIAISLLHTGVTNELYLNDLNTDLAEGEALDLAHGSSFYPTASVKSVGIEQMLETDVLVFAAGRGGTAEESRLDLLRGNAKIAQGLGEKLRNYKGIVVVVSNPVDILCTIICEASGLDPRRVIGTGTMLDTARLRQLLGEKLELDPRAVNCDIVGEHGDSQVVLWHSARIGGKAIRDWRAWKREEENQIAATVRDAAIEIIKRKGATNHAIGLVTAALIRWILRGERRILNISTLQQGSFGIEGIALSLPTIVGSAGAERIVAPELTSSEIEALQHSAETLRKAKGSII